MKADSTDAVDNGIKLRGKQKIMKKHRYSILLLFFALFLAVPCSAAEDQKEIKATDVSSTQPASEPPAVKDSASEAKDKFPSRFQLGEVTVKDSKESRFLEQKVGEPSTQDIIPRKTIDLMVGPAQIQPFKALDLLPSVHSENPDAFGLMNDQNNIRIRGQNGDTFSRFSRAIEGLPISANVGAGFFGSPVDLENLSEMSFVRGAVPVDKGFGYGNAAGALDQSILWSSPRFGATVRQSNGSEAFNRSFLRIDSGQLPSKTSFFASGSYTTADKWRGPGNGDRKNASLGVTQKLPADIKISFLGAYNNLRQDAYRPLTYAQTLDDSFYRGFDYNQSRSGDALADSLYYGYNRQEFDEYLGMLLVEYKPTESSYLTVKPYYYRADGYRIAGSGTTSANSYISRNNITQDQHGLLAEYGIHIGPALVKLGYYYQSMDTMPPASDQKNYSISSSGLAFKNWAYISKVDSRTFHEPYLGLNSRFGKFRIDAGIKYVQIGLPGITGYNTTGVPDVSYNDAFNYTTPMAGMHVGSTDLNEWLPYVGLYYEISKQANARLTYGRNYASPWSGPVYSTYYSNSAKFQAAGISLQDLWNDMKLETSDNFDLGFRYDQGSWYVAPTLFYSRFHNKQVPGVYDPLVKLSYYQNNAKAESKGVEIEAGVTPVSGLTIFGSASYNDFTFTDNIRTAASAIVSCKGKQVADSPQYMVKLGVSYTVEGFTVTPVFRYIGKRYGDAENKERIDAYDLVDLDLGYVFKKTWGFEEISLGLNVSNIFNEKYIGIIRNYQDMSQALSTTYYPGAPRTIIGSVGFKF
jgi:iron complex outermembrane receptor protein